MLEEISYACVRYSLFTRGNVTVTYILLALILYSVVKVAVVKLAEADLRQPFSFTVILLNTRWCMEITATRAKNGTQVILIF